MSRMRCDGRSLELNKLSRNVYKIIIEETKTKDYYVAEMTKCASGLEEDED